MEHARALWEELGLPPLNVRAPWHGYALGEWTEEWENFACRTAAGDWQQTGKETLARQQKGLLPETPVRPWQVSED
jgi:4-hydroxy-3-polyprenylbenzoate decarboxylase